MFDDMNDLEKVEQIREVLSTLRTDALAEAAHAWELRDKDDYDLWECSGETLLLALSLIDQAFPEFRQREKEAELDATVSEES